MTRSPREAARVEGVVAGEVKGDWGERGKREAGSNGNGRGSTGGDGVVGALGGRRVDLHADAGGGAEVARGGDADAPCETGKQKGFMSPLTNRKSQPRSLRAGLATEGEPARACERSKEHSL